MAFYSDDLIEEIRSKNDIVDVISQYVTLQKKGSTHFGLCPFHNEKTPSFSVSRGKQMFYCFGCGAGGTVFTFLQSYNNMTFPEAVEYLAGQCGVTLPKREMTPEERAAQDRRSRLFEINREAAKYYYSLLRGPHGKHALSYFTGRGLSGETMQRFGLGYSDQYRDDLYRYLRGKGYEDDILKDSGLVTMNEAHGPSDKFWNRAMFPIMDPNGKVVAFGGRVMGEGEPKYLNSPETPIFNKSRTLYGLHVARKTRREELILCEGYMDVISLHQAGFDNAVASLGTALTPGHASIIRRYRDRAYLCYDMDGAGRKAALRAIPILKSAGIACRVIDMSPHKDPDEFLKNLGAEAFSERIKAAENSFLFTIRMLKDQFELSDPGEKFRFQEAVADQILENFPEEMERNNYIEEIERIYHFGSESFRRLIASRAGKAVMKAPAEPPEEEGYDRPGGGYSGKKRRGKKEGMALSERLLLTWIVEMPELFSQISAYIQPVDFTEPMCRRVAKELYAQIENEGMVNPSKIVNRFSDMEEQQEAAKIFNATVGEFEKDEDMEKALRETVLRVKKQSMEAARKAMDPADINALKKVVEDKKKLEEMQKAAFHIYRKQ